MTARMIPLNELRFGHEASPPINARRVGRDEGVPEMAASIGAHGLITALKVKEIDGVPYVGIGNRRLAAMRLLVEQSSMAADSPTKCEDFDERVDDVREVALAEQIMRTPLHEADQYEEFRALADRGLTEASIASRFGIEAKRVRRYLALGRLSPLILDWWRCSETNRNTIDAVRAFTMAPSIEDQERVFKKLNKSGYLYGHHIRAEFGADDRTVGRYLDFVGIDVYLAAGGKVIEDLFDGDHAVSDPALVKRLVVEKLQAKVDELTADGWSWAALYEDMPQGWSWSWQKLLVSEKKASKDDKAKSGAVVALNHEGKLEITYGVVKPAAAKTAAAKAAGTKEKSAPAISNALAHRLSTQATLATRAALQQEPRLGLVALLAGFVAKSSYGAPIKVSHQGFQWDGRDQKEGFDDAMARLSAMSDADLFRVAAGIAGGSLDMRVHDVSHSAFREERAALAAAIDSDHMSAALLEHFDAKDYFNGASKPFVIKAIAEAINADEARKAEKLKKAELAEFAIKNVPGTGWLPPELRAATYSGPGAVVAKAKVKKAA